MPLDTTYNTQDKPEVFSQPPAPAPDPYQNDPYRWDGDDSPLVEFTESCDPPKTSHHAKRLVKMGKFSRMADKPELTAAKSFWDSLFLRHRPPTPIDGPVRLEVHLRWPHPKGCPKRDQDKALPMVVKPDLDNMAKTITDSLARCAYFAHDAQVCELSMSKRRSPNPGITVRVWRVS